MSNPMPAGQSEKYNDLSKYHKHIAKITSTMLGFEDRGLFTAWVHVDYGMASQGLGGFCLTGYKKDDAAHKHPKLAPNKAASSFIIGVLKACGVDTWEQLKGRTVYVLKGSDSVLDNKVLGIAPLPTEPGEPFIFSEMEVG